MEQTVFSNQHQRFVSPTQYRKKALKYQVFSTQCRSFTQLPCREVINILSFCSLGKLNTLDLRVYCALKEQFHRRATAKKKGNPSIAELQSILKCSYSERAIKQSLGRLKVVLADSRSHSPFPVESSVAGLGLRSSGFFVVPRRILRYLAQQSSKAVIFTVYTLLLRRMPYRYHRARCSARLVADLWGVSLRAAKRAFKRLQEIEMIKKAYCNKHWLTWRYGTLWDIASNWVSPNLVKRRKASAVGCLFLKKMTPLINKDPLLIKETKGGIGSYDGELCRIGLPEPQFVSRVVGGFDSGGRAEPQWGSGSDVKCPNGTMTYSGETKCPNQTCTTTGATSMAPKSTLSPPYAQTPLPLCQNDASSRQCCNAQSGTCKTTTPSLKTRKDKLGTTSQRRGLSPPVSALLASIGAAKP